MSTIGASGLAPPTTTPRFPSPAARACSRNLSAVAASGASTAPPARRARPRSPARRRGRPSSDERTSSLALLGERAGCRWQSLELGQRPLERAEALASEPGLFAKPLPLGRASPRRIGPESLGQGLGALAPVLEPLGGALQPVEARSRLLAAPGRADELAFDAVALPEQRLELLARPVAREARGLAPLVGVRAALLDLLELELRDPRLDRADLAAQLLGPLGRGRLERERAQALLDLGLEVAGALDVGRHPRELQLGAVPAPLEAAEAGGLLDEPAPLLGLRAEDLLDAALADDRAHLAAEADVREQLDEIGAPHR